MVKVSKPPKSVKPYPDFPLFPHASGRWAKKVRGHLVYFGKTTDDPQGERALELWLVQKDYLLAGKPPPPNPEGLTLRELLDRFMVSKKHLIDTRELSPRTFGELFATCQRIGDAFGWRRRVVDLTADDFEHLRKGIAKQWGPVRLGNEIQRVRSVFKFGYDSGLIDRPVRFGPTFKKPSRKVMRLNRVKNGPRMFEADELRQIIDTAGIPLQAMIYLAINCGFGNADIASLPMSALDLKAGWADFPRPKTGVARRCPLWAETQEALRMALHHRTKPKDKAPAKLAFITKYGGPWGKAIIEEKKTEDDTKRPKLLTDDPISKEFKKILRDLELHRPGLGFYSLRHTFATIGGGAKDPDALRALMGYVDESMEGQYRERIDDGRLQAVADHVHGWLFPSERNG
jgi:integrase